MARLFSLAIIILCVHLQWMQQATASVTPPGVGLAGATYGRFACALFANDDMRCFGFLGNRLFPWFPPLSLSRSRTPQDEPLNLRTGNDSVASISLGSFHGCVLYESGRVKCFGSSYTNALGYGDYTPTPPLSSVPYLNTTMEVKQVEVGCKHTCVILADGRIKCFGSNAQGQSGQNAWEARNVPVDEIPFVDLGEETARSIALGCFYTCVVLDSGAVRCFGYEVPSGYNALSDRRNSSASDFHAFGTSMKIAQLSAGPNHLCAVFYDRRVKCVGLARDGQLGYLSKSNLTSLNVYGWPTLSCEEHPEECKFVPVEPNISSVVTGTHHTCVLAVNGRVQCFGTTGWNSLEWQIFELDFGNERVVQLHAGASGTCGLLESG